MYILLRYNFLVVCVLLVYFRNVHAQLGAPKGNMSVVYKLLNQSAAKSECESVCPTFRLADVESQQEESMILNSLQCEGFSQAWIGLEHTTNNWTWVQDGRKAWAPAEWSHWNTGEPNDLVTEPICARIRFFTGQVGDIRCSATIPAYICEGDFANPCEPNPCLFGGTCCVVNFDYHCTCTEGRHGHVCESTDPNVPIGAHENLDVARCRNECASNPCQNGGVCVDHLLYYECLCKPVYTGLHCESYNDIYAIDNYYLQDGSESTIPSREMTSFTLKVGSQVECASECMRLGGASFTLDPVTKKCIIYSDQSGEYDKMKT